MLSKCSEKFLCCYVNNSNNIQVARITNIDRWYFERVVFPGQRLLFEAPRSAELEIFTGSFSTALLSQRIKCEKIVCS